MSWSRRWRLAGAAVGVALVVGACASSGSGRAASDKSGNPRSAKRAPTTSTTHGAIGLFANSDEKAEQIPDQPLDPATRQQLASQLVIARQVAMKYPTVADATKAGTVLAGLFTPGAGAHYISIANNVFGRGRDGTFDPAKPAAYIYDGIKPTSRIVGLMYASYSILPPAGFPGPNDHWHRHTNVCVVFGHGGIQIPYPPDTNVTEAQCRASHGMFLRQTYWMVHAWVVPGWESPQGVFSHANIDLHCGDGTDHTDSVGFCAGSDA